MQALKVAMGIARGGSLAKDLVPQGGGGVGGAKVPPTPLGALGGERLMGAATSGGKGVKKGTRVSGERPVGAARFRQQCTQASSPPPPLSPDPQTYAHGKQPVIHVHSETHSNVGPLGVHRAHAGRAGQPPFPPFSRSFPRPRPASVFCLASLWVFLIHLSSISGCS